ncbi:hypothetical protein ACTFIW_010551 [Dictyostelium discoideum]
MNKNLQLILFIILINLKFFIDGLKVLNSTLTLKDGTNVFGAVLYFAVIELELDSYIYKYDALACPNYQCSTVNTTIDCSCDYTNFSNCPKTAGRDPSCSPCPIPTVEYCPSINNWVTVEKDIDYIFETNQTMYLRYKGNSSICEGLMARSYPIKGFHNVKGGSSPLEYLQRSLSNFRPQIYGVMNLCPSDIDSSGMKSWTHDTFFFTIKPFGNTDGRNVSLSFRITSKEVSSEPIITDSCTSPFPTTHRCIYDGEFINEKSEASSYHFFVFNATKSAIYTIRAPQFEQSVRIYASINSQYPQLNGYGNQRAEYSSIDEFENSITIYLNKSTILYISIENTYKTNYSLSITSQGYYLPVNVSSLPPKAGAYALVKSSQIDFGKGVTYDCDSWDTCTRFTVNYPFTDSNPLNPIPSGLYSIPNFYLPPYPLLDYDEEIFLANPVKPKSFTMSVLVAYKLGSSAITNLDYLSEISASLVRFKSNIFDQDGNAINNVASLTHYDLPCDYEEFSIINNAILKGDKLLYDVTDINTINRYSYMLDSLTIRNSWIGCNAKANSLFELSFKITNYTMIICDRNGSTPEFNEDPCCNPNQKYFQCCNPKPKEIDTVELGGLSYETIQSKCSFPSCTESVLSQFNSTYVTLDFCTLDNGIYDQLRTNLIQVVRSCKENSSPICIKDSDCIDYAGPDAICDLMGHTCIPNYKYTDYKYLKCVFSQLDQVTTYNLLHKPFSLNSSIIDEIYEKYQKQDCITEGTYLSQRLQYRWDSIDARIQDPNKFYPSSYGLDDSNPIINDIMYAKLFDNFKRTYSWAYFDYCTNFSICPWVYQNGFYNGFSNDPNLKPIIDYCNQISGFCGNCANGLKSFCNTFDFSNQNICEQTDYCVLGGNYLMSQLNMTQQQCESYGMCSVNCGYQCSFSNPTTYQSNCFVLNVNQTQCTSMSYTWDSNLSACIDTTATSKSQCTNHHWLNCTEKPIDECTGPFGTLFNYCSLQPIVCSTKEECENAGVCSDSFFFNPTNTQAYPFNLGKCVHGHEAYRQYPSCEYNIDGYIENDSPMGCFSYTPQVLTKVDCEALGSNYTWWPPATNKQDCLKSMGCKVYATTTKTDMLPYNIIFNQMNQDECLGCYGSQNEYTNKFEWTPATWLPATLVKGKWYTPDPITNQFWTPINNLTTTLDYGKLYDDLVLAVNSQMTDQIRSSYFCRTQRFRDNLDSIACSCADTGGYRNSTCFKDSALLFGQVKPCSSKSETFNFPNGFIEISNSSVEVGCGDMLIFQLSREIFISTEGQSFPSNFVSYPKPDNFGLFNNNSAIVGTIIGDGLTIESKSINRILLCFLYSGNPDEKKYPILDFGCQDQDTGILHPMGLNVFIETQQNLDFLCSNITHLDSKQNYFPINRIGNEDWRKVEKKYFDQKTLGLLYTLAAIYLVVLVYGFYQLIIVAIIRFKKIIHRFELVHLLLFMIFVFLLVRTIYFFLLPSGKLSNSAVADYILVVLPTFFYFSCFTIIIVLWYVIVVLVLKNNSASNFSNRLFSIVGLVNFIIYLLLVAIVLVFQYTKDSPHEFCGSRIIFHVDTNKSQKTVSILYAVIQAVISLVLGVAFIYLGGSLYRAMRSASQGAKKGGLDIKKAHSRELKIFLLTTICSTGFLLHCLFIIILVALNEPSIVFSFIGLIITEIIPSITILYCYDQRTSLSLDITLSSKSSKSFSSTDTKLQTVSETITFSQNLSSE